jgi:hypothetical protein
LSATRCTDRDLRVEDMFAARTVDEINWAFPSINRGQDMYALTTSYRCGKCLKLAVGPVSARRDTDDQGPMLRVVVKNINLI